jgi:hypothetical protein
VLCKLLLINLLPCTFYSFFFAQSTLAHWFKWTEESPGDGGRVSGSVCGQDPKYGPTAFVF